MRADIRSHSLFNLTLLSSVTNSDANDISVRYFLIADLSAITGIRL